MPNPVSQTCPSALFTRIWAGLRSLWTRPRWWSLPNAATMPMARRRKRPTSIGAPSSRSSGSPPGSSSTSMVCPRSRMSSSGRTAQLRPIRPSAHIREPGDRAWPAPGAPRRARTASTARRLPSACRRHPRQKTRSPSSHKTWRSPSFATPNGKNRSNCRTSVGKPVVAAGPASWRICAISRPQPGSALCQSRATITAVFPGTKRRLGKSALGDGCRWHAP